MKKCKCGAVVEKRKGNVKYCLSCSAAVKAMKSNRCDHEKPLFSNGKPRKICFDCAPRLNTPIKKKYALKEEKSSSCAFCCAIFILKSHHNKYCSAKCRNAANNLVGFKRLQERIKTDQVLEMKHRVRSLIKVSFRVRGYSKNSKAQEIIGCSWDQFKKHIEMQFTEGMSWGLIKDIHIDHIVPVCTAKSIEEVFALNHFTNLRPMWAVDNLRKSGNITHLI